MFALFAYPLYYPGGGMNDLRGLYPTLEAVKSDVEKFNSEGWLDSDGDPDYLDQYQIVDFSTGEVIESGKIENES